MPSQVNGADGASRTPLASPHHRATLASLGTREASPA